MWGALAAIVVDLIEWLMKRKKDDVQPIKTGLRIVDSVSRDDANVVRDTISADGSDVILK